MGFNVIGINDLCNQKVVSEARRLKCQEIAKISGESCFNNMIRSISKDRKETQPFYILDLGAIVKLMEKWNQCLPSVTPFYAVKCNYDPALLAALAALGAGFDCASMPEMEAILALGVAPERIVYANPIKQVSHIQYAAKVGVNLTTFDSKEELDKIKKHHPKSELLLRIKVPKDNTSWRSFGNKFGAQPEEVLPLLEHAKKLDMKVVGVSFHVGSKASEADIYRRAIVAAKLAFEAAALLKMPEMHVLNIGGGFKANPLFGEIAETVNRSIQEVFASQERVKVMAEPGRFFAETVFTMVTNVIGKRVRAGEIQYWIDDGIYGSFNTSAFDHSSIIFNTLEPELVENNKDSVVKGSTIFGPTCDSLDIVVKECKLPEMKVDDLVVFYNMGAYTCAAGTTFNGFQRIRIPTYLAYSV